MKKILLCLALILSILISLVSCGAVKDINPDTVVNNIVDAYKLTGGGVYMSSSKTLGEYLDKDLIISYYGDATEWPDFKKVESYCVYIDDSDPRVITDVGIFKLNDADYCETLMKFLQIRIDDKIAIGKAYPDIDIKTLENSFVRSKGNYVYYVVAPEAEKITEDIEKSLGK